MNIRQRHHWVCVGLLCALAACSDAPIEESQPADDRWADEYGATNPVAPSQSSGKSDGVGRPGPQTSWDDGASQVWAVTQQWADLNPSAGLAWAANSGLDWNQKYDAWISSLEVVPQPDSDYQKTFEMTTPEGRTILAPVLECAEVAIFLRATFASWYGLPFFLEARDGRKRIYLGHFGFKDADGKNYGGTPNFKSRYTDYTQRWSAGQAWPSDTRLRSRGLYGGGDEVPFLDPVQGKAARAGAYFDHIYLNKRVGHFMLLALSWFGSVHLADAANMYHLKAEHIRAGDVLLQRWQRIGVGHTVPVMRVKHYPNDVVELAVATGSMPRRFPKWEDGSAAGRYFTDHRSGGVGENDDGDAYAKLGGGLRRWRVAVPSNGQYRNTFLAGDEALWINSGDHAGISDRIAVFESILKELSPVEKKDLALRLIGEAREHLSKYPASCSARIRREQAFEDLYQVNADYFWRTPEMTDAEYRILDDYVFAELVYDRSRTCCWNSSTAAMYDLIMEYNLSLTMDENSQSCNEPTVFMARDVSMDNDGYADFRRYAESVGQGALWVQWSADESCPQGETVTNDTEAVSLALPYCELNSVVIETRCGDTGTSSDTAPLLDAGTHENLLLCPGETDVFAFEGVGNVRIDAQAEDGDGQFQLSVADANGAYLGSARASASEPGELELIEFNLEETSRVIVTITARTNSTSRPYKLFIQSE